MNIGRHRFEVAEPFWKQLQNAAGTDNFLQADILVKAKEPPDDAQSSQIHEKPVQREPADQVSFWIFQNAAGLGFGAGVFEKLSVVHPGGAGGHASQAAEAKIHFVRESFRGFEPAISNGAHERNAATRAVTLEFCGVVSGAGGQAKAAMHALLEDGVI